MANTETMADVYKRQMQQIRKENPLLFVTREEWGAQPVKVTSTPLEPLSRPVEFIGITHITQTTQCKDKAECINVVQEIQRRDLERGLPDVAFNFLIGDDGHVFEGRGWDFKPHRAYLDGDMRERAIDIAFIGDFKAKAPPPEMFNSVTILLRDNYENGNVYELYSYLSFFK